MERSKTPSPQNRRVSHANTQGAKIIRIEVMGRVKDYLNLLSIFKSIGHMQLVL